MNKTLCGIFCLGSLLIFSCNTVPKNMELEQVRTEDVVELIHKGIHTQNMETSDKYMPEQNNVISYGTIAGAKLEGYEVTRKHYPSLSQSFRQRYIIIHYTALDNERSIEELTKKNVSVHYLINDIDDGEIYQLVDENKRAYHAGVSSWRQDNNINNTSIGIEIVNIGAIEKCYDNENIVECEKIFHDYPYYQIEKTIALVKDIAKRYDIAPTNILAHSDIAPTRKHDPGPKFPWKKLYDFHQLGMWYDEDIFKGFLNTLEIENFETKKFLPDFIYGVQHKFKSFGYGIEPSQQWDKYSEDVVRAFQYHFRPEKGDGVLDIQTYAILLSLLKKYPNPSVKNNF